MTVIWTTNHGSQAVRRTGLARIKPSDWLSPLQKNAPTPPGNSAQLGRAVKLQEIGPKSPIEHSGPKEPCENARIGQRSRGVYRRINDSVTCERIHKIGVQLLQC